MDYKYKSVPIIFFCENDFRFRDFDLDNAGCGLYRYFNKSKNAE